jgi:ubiquitin carboxyl-terminal hydrolase MINDY-3/4
MMDGNVFYRDDSDDFEDAELQRALALSLQQSEPFATGDSLATPASAQQRIPPPHSVTIPTSIAATSSWSNTALSAIASPAAHAHGTKSAISGSAVGATPNPPPPALHQPATLPSKESVQSTELKPSLPLLIPSPTTRVSATAEPFDGIVAFHKLMWDDPMTTLADKERWLSQGIDVRDNGAVASSSTVAAAAAPPATTDALDSGTDHINPNDELMDTTLPPMFWGLIQEHGGPCGVLAAVQAELLRVLLFSDEDYHNVAAEPDTDNDLATRLARASPHAIRAALACSIALILARAALTPSAVSDEQQRDPVKAANDDTQNGPVVRIVLPNVATAAGNDQRLQWHELEPWIGVDDHAVVVSSSLTAYSIQISNENVPIPVHHINDSLQNIDATSKRQKVQDGNDIAIDNVSASTSLASRIDRAASLVESFLLDATRGGTVAPPLATASNNVVGNTSSAPLDCFRRQGGVLLMVMSLTATRPFLQQEFDDPVGSRLVAQFGHTGQELINLLLTGQAVSNVFDNTLSPSGDMVCRGIQSRPVIGYLSQLEAMRYLEVGGYYKSPLCPIWVVGSTSHFTVLFGDQAALKESKSDLLLDECRRAFKAVEGGEENGFIKTEQLGMVLKSLNIRLGDNEPALSSTDDADELARQQTLAASLEVSGAGIILWDDFWKAASRLLTGASLETVLQGDGTSSATPMIVDGASNEAVPPPPPLLTNYAANPGMHIKPAAQAPTKGLAFGGANYVESDEEMARRLGAEWGSDVGGLSTLSNVASMASSMEIEPSTVIMSDEEMARKLQAQFDSEETGVAGTESAGSVDGLVGSSIRGLSDTDDNSSTLRATPTQVMFNIDFEESNAKPAARSSKPSAGSHTFEQFGDSFSLFHYNGLRGGILTPFRVTRLTAEEAVGSSIALNRGAGGSTAGLGGGSQDLEDVVRTKWPSCAINWFGRSPPFID